ncbi:19320_t:CDS:2, partial [Cetraspora pellucida]
LVRKAIWSAVEIDGESLYYLKRILNDWFTEEQRLAYISDNNKENFDISQSSIEISQTKDKKPITQNKYGKYGIIEHYIPT